LNVFSKPFDKITFDDVAEFCKQKHPESTTLDYKQAMPRDLAKHFATFSNTLGGVIIIGVEEDPKTGLPHKWDGVDNDAKLIERVNQFAANVIPLPTYSVRLTDEVDGKCFLLISILEGDVAPYLANGDPTVWLRTGNTSTPLRQANRDELVRMVEKKNAAKSERQQNLAVANSTFLAGLESAEKERLRLLADGKTPGLRTEPWNIDNAFLTVHLQPFYPKRLLVEPWDLKASLNNLQTTSNHGMTFPPLDMVPIPNGLFATKTSIFGGGTVRAYQLYGNGLVHYTEDIWWRDEKSDKNIYLAHIAHAFYRQLIFARKFYAKFGYSGVLVGEITLENALGASIHIIVPNGYDSWHDAYVIEKLNDYRWPLELDTHILADEKLTVDLFKKVMRKVYWDLGIETVEDEVLDKYLEQSNWR
jgi:hypothetical protein